MKVPFTQEQFLQVFEEYNTVVWPTQIIFYLVAFTSLFFIIKKRRFSNQLNTIMLVFLWLWMGLVYHILFFSTINKAAYLFGVVFILQALLLIYIGLYKKQLNYYFDVKNKYHLFALVLIIYALVIYPIIGNLVGHVYPASPTFGLPCPTTIFTFGILLLSVERVPISLFIIPLLWSILGFFAAINFGIIEDTGLLFAGVISSILLLVKHRQKTEGVDVHSATA